MRKAAPEFREPPFWYPGTRTAGRRFCQNGGNLSEKLIRNPRIRIDFFLSLLYDCYNKWILGSWPLLPGSFEEDSQAGTARPPGKELKCISR